MEELLLGDVGMAPAADDALCPIALLGPGPPPPPPPPPPTFSRIDVDLLAPLESSSA